MGKTRSELREKAMVILYQVDILKNQKVEFTVDIRSINNDYINDITSKIRAALDYETEKMGGSYEMDNKLTITPVDLSEEMLQIMEDDCKEKGYSCKRLPSGRNTPSASSIQIRPHRASRRNGKSTYGQSHSLCRQACR